MPYSDSGYLEQISVAIAVWLQRGLFVLESAVAGLLESFFCYQFRRFQGDFLTMTRDDLLSHHEMMPRRIEAISIQPITVAPITLSPINAGPIGALVAPKRFLLRGRCGSPFAPT